MSCQVVNSQAQTQSRLPQLPASLPQTQGQWTQFMGGLSRWGQILQQEQQTPNVIPSQFQTFTSAAATPVIAALTETNCVLSVDATQQYYGAASLKVAISSAPATVAFAGTPLSIAPATRWFCSFQVYAPSGTAGSLSVKTSGGTVITESFTVPASGAWQQVWGIFDLRAVADSQATWELAFTNAASVWLDGIQMNSIGDPIANLPKFTGTQMITGALAYASNLDGVPNGSTYARTLATYLVNGVPYNYRGAWSSATSYNQGDEVTSGGNYFLALAPSTNEPTSNATYWQLLGPTSLQTISDGTSRFAQQIYPLGNNTGTAEWVHIGTLVLTQGSSASFYWASGSGYNSGGNQQSIAELTVRASNGGVAPNLSGISAINTGATQIFVAVKAAATAASTSPTNTSWELYAQLGEYTFGPLEAVINLSAGDSFTFSGATASDPGAASSTVVIGNVAAGLNPVAGSGLDALPNGTTYARTLSNYLVNGVPYNYRGAWSSTTAYNQGDEVTSGGNYFLAIAANTNEPTSNATYWQLLGPTSLQTISDGTSRFAQQIYPLNNNTSAAAWVHIGTLVLTVGSSASFYWASGSGYNSGGNQQSIAELTVRAASGATAPNLSGISAINTGASQIFESVKAAATGGNTSPTNSSWEIYAQLGSYTIGPLEAVINLSAGDSFTFSGATASDPGAASSTVVIGNVAAGLNPVAGSGLDALPDGTTYARMLGVGLTSGVVNTTGLVSNAATDLAVASVATINTPATGGAVNVASLTVGPYTYATTVVCTGTGSWENSGLRGTVLTYYMWGTGTPSNQQNILIPAGASGAPQYGVFANEQTFSLPANTTNTYYLSAETPGVYANGVALNNVEFKVEVIKR